MRMAVRRSSTAVNVTCPSHFLESSNISFIIAENIFQLSNSTRSVKSSYKSWALLRLLGEGRHQNRAIFKAYLLFSLECYFWWQLPKLAHNLKSWGVVSLFAFATPLTGVSIVSRVHHREDHNACRVVVIVAYDIRLHVFLYYIDNYY